MNSDRLGSLKIAALALLAFLVLDRMVLTPGIRWWNEQGERIAALRKDVTQGRLVVSREAAIRERWAEMQRTDLPDEVALAESEVFKAIARWGREGRITFTGLNPQWQTDEEGYATLECRANATGDQVGMVRFLRALEEDPLPVRLESWELSSIDSQGQRVQLSARFSALRIQAKEQGR